MDTNKPETEKLFKAVYGTLIDTVHEPLSNSEVVRIALRTVHQFAAENGIRVEYMVHD